MYKLINCDFSVIVLTLVKVTFEPGANDVWHGYFTYDTDKS
jgi:hypothetical protein